MVDRGRYSTCDAAEEDHKTRVLSVFENWSRLSRLKTECVSFVSTFVVCFRCAQENIA